MPRRLGAPGGMRGKKPTQKQLDALARGRAKSRVYQEAIKRRDEKRKKR